MQRLGEVSVCKLHVLPSPADSWMRTVSAEGPLLKPRVSWVGRVPFIALAKDCPHVCPGT